MRIWKLQWHQFVLWTLCCLVSLYALEKLLLKVHPGPLRNRFNHEGKTIYQHGEDFWTDYRPNQTFTNYLTAPDGGAKIENRINSLSIRGEEPSPKRPGIQRILLLGDSFLEAEEVNEEAVLGSQMGRLRSNSYEFVQKGMSGWSPVTELNWFHKVGLGQSFDGVILFLSEEDFLSADSFNSTQYHIDHTTFDSNGLPVKFSGFRKKFDVPFPMLFQLGKEAVRAVLEVKTNTRAQITPNELDAILKKHGEEYRTAVTERFPALSAMDKLNDVDAGIRDVLAVARPQSIWEDEVNDYVGNVLDVVERFRQLASSHHISLAVALIPSPWTFDKKELYVGRKAYGFANVVIPSEPLRRTVAHFCAKQKLPFIDLYPVLAKAKEQTGQRLYFNSDFHWTANGHRVVAEYLSEQLDFVLPKFNKLTS